LITVCYLLVTTGVVKVSHFCMNRLASISFYEGQGKTCDKCGMHKEAHGCCHDIGTLVKLDSAHQKVSTSSPELPIFSEQPLLETKYLLSALRNTPENATILVHPPPLLSENSIYLKNSVFLI